MPERGERSTQHQGSLLFWINICKYTIYFRIISFVNFSLLLFCGRAKITEANKNAMKKKQTILSIQLCLCNAVTFLYIQLTYKAKHSRWYCSHIAAKPASAVLYELPATRAS